MISSDTETLFNSTESTELQLSRHHKERIEFHTKMLKYYLDEERK